ncbi:hypothetical protein [Leptothoe kymatousa]|uniref:Uncharacterized protein n=1 Tax=Leptothoe kymatousa TAU-MAC 1615 TaxID=2364775 RepID=A0ABS5Y456_9CYAN|nr:hypothetical protein [Leptothoe kymatousa]MBT9312618.1 hypothetical protein [Leptothoe kymatousa TAU-MAC 1615]
MKAVAIASVLISLGAVVSPGLAQETTPGSANPVVVAQAAQSLDTVIRNDDTLYLNKNEVHEYNLRLQDRTAVDGRFLPAGSIIRGQFEPVDGGLRYVADSAEVGDRIFTLSAVSETLTDRKDPRQTDTDDIIEDAAIGAAGGLIIGEVLGDADLLEVLGGAAAGVVVGNVTAPTVVVIEPDQSILLYQN